MSRRLSLLLPVFSALLCALALPNELLPLGSWPLGFIALAPLYIAIVSAGSMREAAACGALFGALQHALTSYWLFFYKDFALWTIGGSTLAYAIVYAAAGMYARFLLEGGKAGRPALFAAGWVMLEFLKSSGFLGYPWGLIPYSMTAIPLMLQTADLFGVYGVSALLSYTAALSGEALLPSPSSTAGPRLNPLGGAARAPRLAMSAAAGLAFILLFIGYGAWKLQAPLARKATLGAILVQQNTDPWLEGEMAALESNVRLAGEALDRRRATGASAPELIVFSETSLRRPYREFIPWFSENPKGMSLGALISGSGAHLLTGAPVVHDWKTFEASNATILISPSGELVDTYAKIHPVPFAESIPLMEFAWFRTFMRDVVGMESGWRMGDRLTVFELPAAKNRPALRFGTPICFEDAFSELCRGYIRNGADLLINLTNDSWSRTESAQVQHWAIARIRAIELRRTLVRSTNAGVTSVIDPRGIEVFGMPQFTAMAAAVDIPVLSGGSTPFLLWGDWFAALCVLLAGSRFIILIVRQASRRRLS